jgi:hypothetical protein
MDLYAGQSIGWTCVLATFASRPPTKLPNRVNWNEVNYGDMYLGLNNIESHARTVAMRLAGS